VLDRVLDRPRAVKSAVLVVRGVADMLPPAWRHGQAVLPHWMRRSAQHGTKPVSLILLVDSGTLIRVAANRYSPPPPGRQARVPGWDLACRLPKLRAADPKHIRHLK
jgi:hypothetical protein